MGIGTSLVLVAVGAILAFGVDVHSRVATTTIHWHTIGWILILVGVIGLVMSLIWLASSRRRVVAEGDYLVDRDPVV